MENTKAHSSENIAEIGDPIDPLTAGLGGEFARQPAQRDSNGWTNLHPTEEAPVVVGIAGGTGSGKTTVAAAIAARLGEANLIHLQHDAYYKPLPEEMPLEERAKTNFDHPDSLETSLLCEHLRQLKSGRAVRVPTYDFATHQRLEGAELKEPARIILVEGILIYAHEELRKMLDIKIFVDTESDVRFIRRLQRDVSERGRDVNAIITQYMSTVRPMHVQFVEPSKRNADVIIPTGYNSVAMEMVIARLEQLLEWGNEVPDLKKRQSTPRLMNLMRNGTPKSVSTRDAPTSPTKPRSPKHEATVAYSSTSPNSTSPKGGSSPIMPPAAAPSATMPMLPTSVVEAAAPGASSPSPRNSNSSQGSSSPRQSLVGKLFGLKPSKSDQLRDLTS